MGAPSFFAGLQGCTYRYNCYNGVPWPAPWADLARNNGMQPSNDTNIVLTIQAPAKVNLHLRVLGRRDDGYHDIATLMQPLDLADRLTIDLAHSDLTLTCSDPELQVPDNLVLRAAEAFFQAAGITPRGRFDLQKNIPVAAGLGGGSSDAAATLMGLNRLHGHPLGTEDLHRLAASLGADVPFFLVGQSAWCTGIGEKVEPWPEFPLLQVVLVNPGFALSTARVYREFDLSLKNHKLCTRISRPSKEPDDLPAILVNDLELVSLRAHSQLKEIKRALLDCGASGAVMSGSGPTIVGIFEHRGVAKDAAIKLTNRGNWWVRHCKGVKLKRPG